MKILLVAYEFPPVLAAQALRWFYLTNELAAQGVEVHVLCPAFPSLKPYAVPKHPGVIEHRVWPGPFIGLSQWFAGHADHGQASNAPAAVTEKRLLFRVYRAARTVLNVLLYPDVRTEWYPFARRAISHLIRQHRFDVIVSSHEPGVDLLVGLWAKRRFAIPWVVDLADPLCAPYSLKWRRWLDLWLEGKVIRTADSVILTTDELGELLLQRHKLADATKFVCIPQGSPVPKLVRLKSEWVQPDKLHIVFTGNFYELFRSPAQFANALRSLSNSEIALTVVGDNARFQPMFDGIDNVYFTGRLDHFECLACQSAADILLNIGNVQSYQVPGKIYEYLGTGKPILHLRGAEGDPSEALLAKTGNARVVVNSADAIEMALRALLKDWQGGALRENLADIQNVVALHGWPVRAMALRAILEALTHPLRELV